MRRSLLIVLPSLVALATGACSTYPQQAQPRLFYEVPCDMPGAFRADVHPTDSAMAHPTGSTVQQPATTNPPNAVSAVRQPLCLAQADLVPPRYARRPYSFYNDYWGPYQSRGYFGLSVGFGGRHGGGHRGMVHHGGGRHHR